MDPQLVAPARIETRIRMGGGFTHHYMILSSVKGLLAGDMKEADQLVS